MTCDIVERLAFTGNLSDGELLALLQTDSFDEILFAKADEKRREIYGTDVYLRGLIEFTDYCRNNCYYCGIRRENRRIERYRMTSEEILAACEKGYEMGYRTFVLQGGEDSYFSGEE